MEPLRDAAFLDEIATLLESLDASNEAPVLPDILSTPLEPEEHVSETVETASPAPENNPPTSRVRRSRQRQEIEYLRAHVRELESELAKAQEAVGQSAVATTVAKDVVWQRVAMRQMSAKQKAEAENARLREMLQGQLKVARALEKLLRKRTCQTEVAPISKRLKRDAASSDAAIFEQLREYLDERFYEVDSVFRENGLATTETDWEDVNVIGHDIGGPITLELLHARVLPFDFASTSAAVWKCSNLSSLQLPEGHTYEPLSIVDDEVTSKFEVAAQLRRQYVTVHVQMVMRRYREHEKKREVFVWESFSTIVSQYKPFDGLQALDHGWTVVEALPSSELNSPAKTIVRCCSRLAPDEQFVPRHDPIGAFSDFLIAGYNRNYATLLEIVENVLLDDALAAGVNEA